MNNPLQVIVDEPLDVFTGIVNRHHDEVKRREKLLRRIGAVCVGLVCAVLAAVIWGAGM